MTKKYPGESLRDDSIAFGDMYPEGTEHAGADERAGPLEGARWGAMLSQQTYPVHYEEGAGDAFMDVMQGRPMTDRHLGEHSRRGRMSALLNPQHDVGSSEPPLAPSNDPPGPADPSASQSGGSNVRLKFRFGSIPRPADGSTEAGLDSGEGHPLSESAAGGTDASRTRIRISLRR